MTEIYCYGCGNKYEVIEIGIMLDVYENGEYLHTRHGDLLECPICKNRIITKLGNPIEMNFSQHESNKSYFKKCGKYIRVEQN
jgi:hypothetical protein